MQEQKFNDKELLCINVDKVYDWIVRENTFNAFPVGPGVAQVFPNLPSGTTQANSTVTCVVEPSDTTPPPVEIINREDRQFCIDGKNVCLQQLTIQKNFDVTLYITRDGSRYKSANTYPISVSEIVTMCAPDETEVEVTYTQLDCLVVNTGTIVQGGSGDTATATFGNLVLQVTTCQSIQSTFPVTLELCADFCEPREDFVAECAAPGRPPQCPSLFPDGHKGHICRHGHHGYNGHHCDKCGHHGPQQ